MNMPFEIQYDSDMDCIFATFIGSITMTLVKEYIAALLPILEETDCRRLLSDSRTADVQLSSRDIMQFPKLAEASPLTARLRRAVIASPGTSGYELYQTLSEILGHNIQLFTSREEALKWLLSAEEEPS
jgi:hypothetical protein